MCFPKLQFWIISGLYNYYDLTCFMMVGIVGIVGQ